MILSVYDYDARAFRYYEAEAPQPTVGHFRRVGHTLTSPEALAVPLPPGARYVGQGDVLRGVAGSLAGELAPLGEASTASTDPGTAMGWVGIATVAGLAFWLGRKSVGAAARARSRAQSGARDLAGRLARALDGEAS